MLTLDSLTKAHLNQFLTAKSLKKGYQYLVAIRNPQRSGNSLSAHVADNRMYQVEIVVDNHGLHAHCTCPYNWDGGCKHTSAVLLKWVQSPGDFTHSAALAAPAVNAEFPIEVVPVEPLATVRPDQPPLWLTSSLASRQQFEEKQLARWLEMQKVQTLRALAKKRGWPVKGTKKADIAQQLVGPITDPAEIVQAVHNLGAEHAQVFRAMALVGNDAALKPGDIERIARHWGKLAKYAKIITYTGHLCDLGLAIPGGFEGSYPADPDFVPRSIVRGCPPLLEPVIANSANISADLPGATLQLADPLGFLRKAQQLILMLEQTPTPLRPPLPRPKMEKFYPALQHWDYDPHELAAIDTKKLGGYTDLTLAVPPPPPALPDAAITELAPIAGGLAELEIMLALLTAAGVFQPGSPVTVWPEVKEQFFRQSELAQRATLARTWFLMVNWSELWAVLRREPTLQLRRSLGYGGTTPERFNQHLTLFRRQVLRLLASLTDNRWIKVDDLSPLLQTIWPLFDQTRWEKLVYYYGRNQKPSWYLARRNSTEPLAPDNPADWQLAQWNFVIQLITGPLHWLGLVDLYQTDGHPLEIRLHGLADLYWDRAESPDAPHPTLTKPATTSEDAVTIAGETITINPTAVSARVHGLLDNLARLDDVQPDRFVYTLSVQAVHAAFEAGLSLTDLLAGWDELMPHPMPDHLRARLETWWHGYGQARIYQNITVIEFSDDYALAEMKAVTSLSQQIITEISPRLVLIHAAAVDSLTAELEKAGYTPQQTDKV